MSVDPKMLGCKPCVRPYRRYEKYAGPTGTYNAFNSTYNCVGCAAGQFQDATGQTSCKQCSTGSLELHACPCCSWQIGGKLAVLSISVLMQRLVAQHVRLQVMYPPSTHQAAPSHALSAPASQRSTAKLVFRVRLERSTQETHATVPAAVQQVVG